MSTEPGVYDNTSNIQHKVGDACTLCICQVYDNKMPRLLNEIVLAIELWLLVPFHKGNDLVQSAGLFTAAMKVLQKQKEKVQFKSGGTFAVHP